MKRIYIVVLAILLFLGIGVDYFIQKNKRAKKDNYASNNPNNNTLGTSPVETPAVAIDNEVNNPPSDDAALAASDNNGRNMHRRYTHAYRKHKAGFGANRPNNQNLLARNEPGAEITLEKSKDYFANNQNKPKYNEVTNNSSNSDDDHIPRNHRVHFAPEFGLNQNGLYNDQTPNTGTLGFHAGVMANIALGSHFALQPGLMYIGKGNRLQNELDATTREQINLNYIELPVSIVAKIGNVNNCRLLVGAGPYVSYLFYAHDKFESSAEGDVLNVPVPYYQTARLRSFDWGVGGFIGIETPEGIYAKAGAETGLTDIQQNPDGGYSNRNYNLFMTFGYIIGY